MEKDLIFESFRRCITEPKCTGCKWETCGKIINGHPLRIPEVKIPVDLALAVVSLMSDELYKKNDALALLKEQELPTELKQKMWNALYAEEDEYEKKFVGIGEYFNWFTVYRPWLQKGFDIAIDAIADWEGR